MHIPFVNCKRQLLKTFVMNGKISVGVRCMKMEVKVEKKEEETKNKSYKKFWKILLVIAIAFCVLVVATIIWLSYYTNQAGNMVVYKPVIYLYPEKTTDVIVKLGYAEKLTCSYPVYNNGWEVVASPDGTLIDTRTNRELYSLYWEGKGTVSADTTEGFVVKGEDTISFLEEKLEVLGLTNKEAEEFIIYWLPKLQNNEYNYIRFASMEEINEYMPLEFSQDPDTIIRVLMQYKPLEEKVDVVEQKLESPIRQGFVVVEWGGTEIK